MSKASKPNEITDLLDSVDKEIQDDELEEIDEEKAKKIEQEKMTLIARLSRNDMTHLITRVAHILNRFPASRNSDVTLQLKYWEKFHEEYDPDNFDVKDLYKFERLTSIARARAKIQNEYKLFQATKDCRRFRRDREEIEREQQLVDKPETQAIFVYCDESGKERNAKYMIVAGVWNLDGDLARKLYLWKKENNISYEFHFTKMERTKVDNYKAFFVYALENMSMTGLKAITLRRDETGQRSLEETQFHLYEQFIHFGVNHEIQTGRIALPRQLHVIKDKEEGTDRILLVRLKQHLDVRCKEHFADQIEIPILDSVSSDKDPSVQLADLFTGSLARVINRDENSQRNFKDDFADYVLSMLSINLTNWSSSSDMCYIHML